MNRSIKKPLFSDEIAATMHQQIHPELKKQASLDLVQALDYLNSAYDIFESAGLSKQADQIINILNKIAGENHPSKNLEDETANDLLELDVEDLSLEIEEDPEMVFEDEI